MTVALDGVRVGATPPAGAATSAPAMAEALQRMAATGLDHAVVGDHVSFFGGFGTDGLVQAAMLSALHPALPVHTCVYLLALRHPVLVARQISTIASVAPERLVLGVGIGGEDRHEVEVCGVDPRTRGRRMDECLVALRGLLTGDPLTHHGPFFAFEDALVRPAPPEPVPVLVGGRSDAAVRRAGRLGDGWLGIWVSPDRFATATADADAAAVAAGRDPAALHYAMTVWCGFGDDPAEGRRHVAPVMEAIYGLPFERFERYVPTGDPSDVADALAPYAERGCRTFSLLARGPDDDATIEAAGLVRRELRRRTGPR